MDAWHGIGDAINEMREEAARESKKRAETRRQSAHAARQRQFDYQYRRVSKEEARLYYVQQQRSAKSARHRARLTKTKDHSLQYKTRSASVARILSSFLPAEIKERVFNPTYFDRQMEGSSPRLSWILLIFGDCWRLWLVDKCCRAVSNLIPDAVRRWFLS